MRHSLRGTLAASALALGLTNGASAQSLIPDTSLVKSMCIACHQADAQGRIPTIESIRTTPEGWSRIVRRMNRNYKLELPDDLVEELVNDLSQALSLTPDELQELEHFKRSHEVPPPWDPRLSSRLPAGEPGFVPTGVPATFPRTCLACHGWDVISEQRREPAAWLRLRDMHLGTFPILYLTHRDMDWGQVALEALKALGTLLPMDTPAWQAYRQSAAWPADGDYLVIGYRPGRGQYVEKRTLTEGKLTGEGAAVGNFTNVRGALFRGSLGGVTFRGSRAKADGPIHFTTSDHCQEQWFPMAGPSRLVGVWPSALVGARPSTVKLYLTAAAGSKVNVKGPARVLSVKPEGQALAVELAPTGKGVAQLSVEGAAGSVAVNLSPQVDYLRIYPEEGLSRVGGVKMPAVGVQFEARGFANGPDGKPWTDDDLDLGPAAVTWSMEDYAGTNLDDDPKWVGKLDADGRFTPASEAADPKRQRLMNTGDVWVYARQGPLRARVLLRVVFPDYRPDV